MGIGNIQLADLLAGAHIAKNQAVVGAAVFGRNQCLAVMADVDTVARPNASIRLAMPSILQRGDDEWRFRESRYGARCPIVMKGHPNALHLAAVHLAVFGRLGLDGDPGKFTGPALRLAHKHKDACQHQCRASIHRKSPKVWRSHKPCEASRERAYRKREPPQAIAEAGTLAQGAALKVPLEDAAGNYIALALGDGRHAFYEHLKPDSMTVKAGAHVKRGPVIGQLGFAGESTGPHLHFHVSDANALLDAEGLPYAFERLRVLGTYDSIEAFDQGKPWQSSSKVGGDVRTGEFPAPLTVVDFGQGDTR